jgi:hypothetical protein
MQSKHLIHSGLDTSPWVSRSAAPIAHTRVQVPHLVHLTFLLNSEIALSLWKNESRAKFGQIMHHPLRTTIAPMRNIGRAIIERSGTSVVAGRMPRKICRYTKSALAGHT